MRVISPGTIAAPVDMPAVEAAAGTVPLAVAGLAKRFGAVEVFHDVSFAVSERGSVALIGANGAGKSTLLRCCMRLIEPDHGTVWVHGTAMTGLRRGALRRVRSAVGFVFQRHNLVPRISVLANVLHGSQARGWGPRTWWPSMATVAERELALHCLDLVGCADLARRQADALSGGQSQRVAIARSLMQRPRLLLADEPAASLDPVAGEEVMALFARLVERERLTLVFVSHHLDHALAYSDRIIGLRGGGVALDRPTAGATAAELRELYG